MKKIFSAVFVMSAALASAQITINSSTFMQNRVYVFSTDTSGSAAYNPGNAGPNQSWNFASFQEEQTDTTILVNAAWTPTASSFPTANFAMYTPMDSTYAYYNVTSSALYAVGISTTAAGAGPFGTFAFNNPSKEFKFPMTYLDTVHSHRSFTIELSGEEAGISEVDSVRITSDENVVKEADAYGSLILPTGSHTVLRIKETGSSITIFEAKVPFVGWTSFGEPDTSEVHSYTFQSDEYALPILTLNMEEGDTVNYAQAYKSSFVGINEFEKSNVNVSVYPNPFSDNLTIINSDNSKLDVKIFDIAGKMIESHQITAANQQISLAHLSKGMYILNLMDENGFIKTERLVKQ